MTLYEIVDILKKIALDQPNIRSASDGSVYDKLNTNPSVQYDVFHISQTNHQEDFETDYYGLQLFYISRLEDSLEDNRLQIQSIGKEILGNIIRTFCENFAIDYPTITYIPFTQKFNDLTAGVYCNVRLEVPKDLVCADDYVAEVVPGSGLKLQDIGITITENGLRVITADAEYDGIGEIRIQTEVPQSAAVLQDKEVEYTENGSYTVHPDPAYDGLSSVSVDVDVPDNYDEGYADGKQDGENEQKAKLTVTSFTENNTYTRENGWSAVTVDVPDRYDEGYGDGFDDGEESQKGKLASINIIENGVYVRENGWSALTVEVPSDYQDGYNDGYGDGFNDGEEAQKAKLTTLIVTANGEYSRVDGYSAITVTVPQTGSSNEDLIANLQGDYYLIPYGTTHLRDYAFYETCFSSITIPTTVSAIGNNAFAFNDCLTSITIPDSVQYLGTYAFAYCEVLETAIIGSGISEIRNRTFSGCRALTGITIPSGVTSIGNSVFDGCSALTEMTFEGLTPPTINTGNSLGSTAYTFPIYVPCQSIDAYKTAFGEAYAPRIQCREQEMITAITLNVSSAITDSGTATTTYSPSNAYVDYYYTSSNPSIATIDPNTGVITVVANGSVTICTIDRISGLQDCKEISVTKTPPAPVNIPYTADTSTVAATGETRCVTIDTTGLNTSTIGLVYTGATGLTYVVSGNQVCITFPNNTGLARDFNVEITASTLDGGSAYADITFHQQSVDYQNQWLKVTYLENSGRIANGNGSYDKVTDGTKLIEGNVTGWTGYPANKTLYFHLTGNTIEDREFENPRNGSTIRYNTIGKIEVPSGVTTIGQYAFAGHYKNIGTIDYGRYIGLSSLTLSNTVTSFGKGAFSGNVVLKSVTLPNAGPTVIPQNAFSSCGSYLGSTGGAADIIVPSNVVTIEVGAFHSVCLKSITFPAGLRTIEQQDCNCCGVFPNSKIGRLTFNGTTPPSLGNCNVFGLKNTDYTIYVPSSAVNTYKAAWPNEADKIQAIA